MGYRPRRREAALEASLVISGLLVVCMIGTSAYGARVLPADARIPLHYGFGGYGSFAPKNVGLILWPAAGAVIYLIFLGLELHAIKPNHPSGSVTVILPIVMAVLVLAQVGAIRQAIGTVKNRPV